MVRAVVVRGHLVGPSQVELDEPVDADAREVEVIVRLPDRARSRTEDVASYLRSLPTGTRSKEDIDRQVREERESWD